MAGKGILYGVSVGPGDPELLTLRAVRIIESADVVAVPNIGHGRQTALQIAQAHVQGKELLDCSTPMVHDHQVAMEAYARVAENLCNLLDAGKTVAYLVLGDATVYSTYIYLHKIVRERGYGTEIVPGVTSFCAVAARLQNALCEGPERLTVIPTLAGDWDELLDEPGTKVFMKAGKATAQLKDALRQRGLLDGASMVANCGLPDEQVFESFADADETSSYFSVVVVKDHRDGEDESESDAGTSPQKQAAQD